MANAAGSRSGEAGMPRWVKVFLLVGLLVLVVVVVLLAVGGDHGPGRHASLASAVVLKLAS